MAYFDGIKRDGKNLNMSKMKVVNVMHMSVCKLCIKIKMYSKILL